MKLDFETVIAVDTSWMAVKAIPNHAEIAGELMFRKIFELAPSAVNMYSFGPEFDGKEEELFQSAVFKRHAKGVVMMLNMVINMIGPGLEPAIKVLTKLGTRHISYGVLPAHYGIVGRGLLHALETALGPKKWTPAVERGWTQVYGFISTAMMAGANNHLQRTLLRSERVPTRKNVARNSPKLDRPVTSSVLRRLTGTKSEPSRKLREMADLIDKELFILEEKEDDEMLDSGRWLPRLISGEVNYMRMVESVYTSWDIIKRIPNYAEVAGVLLFRNIFEIAPEARAMFPVAGQYEMDDDAIFEDCTFVVHAKSVASMLDVVVNMLGPDLTPVMETLEDLGARHVRYNVAAAHYPIVGEALLKTLETALGNDVWTPTVQEGWQGVYEFISSSMQKGADDLLKEDVEAYLDCNSFDNLQIRSFYHSWFFVKWGYNVGVVLIIANAQVYTTFLKCEYAHVDEISLMKVGNFAEALYFKGSYASQEKQIGMVGRNQHDREYLATSIGRKQLSYLQMTQLSINICHVDSGAFMAGQLSN
eukprot:scaffold3151_cov110-Cylindrotheca_fusiformis.AAC.11